METTLAPHQERVVTEHAELSEKLGKLETFLGSSICQQLPTAEKARLSRQCLIMQLYQQVLVERIEAFPA